MECVLTHRVLEWKCLRDKTKKEMYSIADRLGRIHCNHRDNESFNAKTSLTSGLIGLGGTLLAPVSGGLSLAAALVATTTSGYTMYSNYQSKNDLSEANKAALGNAETTMKRYESKTKELLEIYDIIVDIEKMELTTDVRDIVFKLSRTKYGVVTSNRSNCNEARLNTSTRSDNTLMPTNLIGGAGSLIGTTMSSSAEIMQFTKTSTKAMQQTSMCTQILHTAKSVNEMSNDLSMLGQTGMLANVARAKSASVMLTSVESSSRSVNAAFTVGQTAIQVAANAKKTSQTTRGVSELALSTDKVVRTTFVSKTVKETSSVSVTATKAGSISKLGVAMSVIAIPIDIYNIMDIENKKGTTPEEVKRIKEAADKLGDDIIKNYTVTITTFEEMHIEILKLYERYHEQKLYEFFEMCHTKLHLKLPAK